MSDAVAIREDVEVENVQKYEYLDDATFRKVADKVIKENIEVLKALAK